MSDVGAVVLTVGEPSTNRALASLEAQTLPAQDVALVEGMRPFHRAFNAGVEQVRAPFLVQVDADMILDADCIELLRNAMAPRVAITVGTLRDPLMGRVVGVKIFRRACLETTLQRDTIGPDADLYRSLGRKGWQTRYLTGHGRRSLRNLDLGAHRPTYTVDYTFGTYYVLGRVVADREDSIALRWRFTCLRRTNHQVAPVARLAIAKGIFGSETSDMTKPMPSASDSAFLRRLVRTRADLGAAPTDLPRLLTLDADRLFEAFSELGSDLRVTSPAGLRGCQSALAEIADSRSLLAEVALGAGALGTSSQPRARVRTAISWLLRA